MVEHAVTLIADLTDAPNPPDALLLSHLQYFWQIKPRNLNRLIIVAPSQFMEAIGKVFVHVVMSGTATGVFVRSFDQAVALLAQWAGERRLGTGSCACACE